jgi:LysM repeat protein
MNRYNRGSQSNADELFAQAVTRLEAGESLASILATYPASMRDELRDMLAIVQAVEEMGQAPIPRPSPTRRAAAKREFLAAAAQLRAERNHATSPLAAQPSTAISSPTRPTTLRPARRRAARRRSNLWEQLQEGFAILFSARAMRLAPILAVLVVVVLSTTTLVTVAQSAVPGDLAYSLKQWLRKQELQLAPPSMRDLVRQEQERELAADVAKAAARADANSAVIRAEDTLLYYGRTGRLLKIGGLTVMDRYQPDANVEAFSPMTIEGELLPGAQVSLAYQIMPGQSDTVQGIALTVVAPPAPDFDINDALKPTMPAVTGCVVSQPDGWVPYEVRPGDNLTFLATRGNTTVTKIMEVNCLRSETILIGAKLYVPADSLRTDRPLLSCGAPLPADWIVYEVKPGDNLSLIAQRSGSTVSELMTANCITSDIIIIGAKLYIPKSD